MPVRCCDLLTGTMTDFAPSVSTTFLHLLSCVQKLAMCSLYHFSRRHNKQKLLKSRIYRLSHGVVHLHYNGCLREL